jgi:hypothetical protein
MKRRIHAPSKNNFCLFSVQTPGTPDYQRLYRQSRTMVEALYSALTPRLFQARYEVQPEL